MILCEKCGGEVEIKRTLKQNNSMHKFFEMIASELNGVGEEFEYKIVNKTKVPYEASIVKDYIWKPVQRLLVKKERTRDITTKECSQIAQYLERVLYQTFEITVLFPSLEPEEAFRILES